MIGAKIFCLYILIHAQAQTQSLKSASLFLVMVSVRTYVRTYVQNTPTKEFILNSLDFFSTSQISCPLGYAPAVPLAFSFCFFLLSWHKKCAKKGHLDQRTLCVKQKQKNKMSNVIHCQVEYLLKSYFKSCQLKRAYNSYDMTYFNSKICFFNG